MQIEPVKSPAENQHAVKPRIGSRFSGDYAPALESRKVVTLKPQQSLYIGGKFIPPEANRYFPSLNPATGETLSEIAIAEAVDVDRAITAARHAYENVWSKISGAERGRFLFRISRILQERAREFAVLETLDNGKPIKESRDIDIPLAAAHFFYYAGWADKLQYACPGNAMRPLGVAAQIIPWNFPLLMAAWKIAPALATGNTVVLKPAETTSLSALLLAEVFEEAGLPAGVVNIVTGAGATGAYLAAHPGIDKLAFTGSTDVGRLLAKVAARNRKRITLELGGKSAQIVFADAAIDQAIEGVVQGIFFNQGHVCCAGSRLLVEESIAEEFLLRLKKRMQLLRVGNPLDKNTDLGAINSAEQLNKIKELIAIGQAEGGELFTAAATEIPNSGFFHKPCLFTGIASAATIFRTEIFGPVLAAQSFRTVEEAIMKANDTRYGLAAGIWSEKAAKVHKVAQNLKAGVIWANTYNKFDPAAPFGGYFESGWGREGGRHGLIPYLQVSQ